MLSKVEIIKKYYHKIKNKSSQTRFTQNIEFN